MTMKNLMVMIVAAGLMLVLIGCSSSDNEAADTPATDDATQVAETHDCDGGCGMTAVPVANLTEIDGKYYCAGCAAKAKTEADAEESHDGHDHG